MQTHTRCKSHVDYVCLLFSAVFTFLGRRNPRVTHTRWKKHQKSEVEKFKLTFENFNFHQFVFIHKLTSSFPTFSNFFFFFCRGSQTKTLPYLHSPQNKIHREFLIFVELQ